MAKHIKGMNKDTAPVDQIEGTYRHAKNMVLNETAGAISNEPGTIKKRYSLGEGEVVIGAIETTKDIVVYFVVGPNGESLIYLDDATTHAGTLRLVLKTESGALPGGNDFDLKFSIDHPIEGSYKIDPDKSIIIYWTDNNVFPRSLNVTRQLKHSPETIYGVDPLTSPNNNYVDRINFFPHAGPVPSILVESINNGGALKSGVYYLFLAYVDQNFTQTNYVAYSLGVPIVEDLEAVLPIERYDGCPADSQTGKAISWSVSNLNTDYEYLRPIVVAKIDGITTAYRLNDVDIIGSGTTITFSFLEGYSASSVEEAIVDTVSYSTVKTLTQLDSIMYLGNLSGTKDIGYQKHANAIQLSTGTTRFEQFDRYEPSFDNLNNGYLETPPLDIPKNQGYRGIDNLVNIGGSSNKRGYMRDEVYAFYIGFILNDGSMSYAYHIPGRKALTNISKNFIYNGGSNDNIPLLINETNNIYDAALETLTGGEGKCFHFYDFALADDRRTNFWENLNERYPNTDDYKVFDGLVEIQNDDLRNKPIRHHRMPTNATVPAITGNSDDFIPPVSGQRRYYYYAVGNIAQEGTNFDNILEGNYPGTQDLIMNGPQVSEIVQYNQWPDGPSVFPSSAVPFGSDDSAQDSWQNLAFVSNAFESVESFNQGHNGVPVNSSSDLYMNWVEAEPEVGQKGWFVWAQGTDGPDIPIYNASETYNNSGMSPATVLDFDAGLQQLGIQQTSITSLVNERPLESTDDLNTVNYAVFIWSELLEDSTGSGTISQSVDPLGVILDNIKIPEDIAAKIQGFRIYYAEREHSNRRVLGQDILLNTHTKEDANLSGCGEEGGTLGVSEDLIVAESWPVSGNVREATFHDFYLLNPSIQGDDGGGVRKSLVPATHTTLEYKVNLLSFRGPNTKYSFLDEGADGETLCQDDLSLTDFHIGRTYSEIPSPLNISSTEHIAYPIREKCKTYLRGDSLYDGRSLGFGRRVSNLGGESSILLGFKANRTPVYDFPDAFDGVPWWNRYGIYDTFGYEPPAAPVEVQVHNLQAFKTDMYLGTDTQKLIWTGFEVLGNDLDNYLIDENGDSVGAADHGTDLIYGGDTFICRHGFRATNRPEWKGEEGEVASAPRDRKSLYYMLCESTDNINFRHETSKETSYFPGSPAKKMLDLKANEDLTDVDNIKYNSDYSLGKSDVRPIIPFPLREADPVEFPNRVQRSAKADNTSLIDNYRVNLALQFKDLPRNRGSIWKLVSMNNLLFIHTEDSLFRTKGKEKLQLSDGVESFIGSGDLFSQEPDELVQTQFGYGGTQSQWVSLVTQHGYLSMDYRNRRVFLYKDKLYDISMQGMENWFDENIPFALEQYGLPANFDNPIAGLGFHSMYDEKYDRILLTKRDLKPTNLMLTQLASALPVITAALTPLIRWSPDDNAFVVTNSNNSFKTILDWNDTDYFEPVGWTISFDPNPQINAWASFHDYIPYKYSRTKDVLTSFKIGNSNIWKHEGESNRGNFYDIDYPSEFEFIFNEAKDKDKVFYSFGYMVDVFDLSKVLIHDHGFSSFYVYDTHQLSGEQSIEYLINTRRVGNGWKINKFRDLARLVVNLSEHYTGPFNGGNYGLPGVTVAGTQTGNVQTTDLITMFNVDGMQETINTNFIDTNKVWHKQRKFTDKWLGVRLKYDNYTKKLINLYTTEVSSKIFYR